MKDIEPSHKGIKEGYSKILSKIKGSNKKLKSTHTGYLKIDNIEIRSDVLEDGRRVLSKWGCSKLLGFKGFKELDDLIHSTAFSPYISRELLALIKSPIKFVPPRGNVIHQGYIAATLVEICFSILTANDAGALKSTQENIAKKSFILIRYFAKQGFLALAKERDRK